MADTPPPSSSPLSHTEQRNGSDGEIDHRSPTPPTALSDPSVHEASSMKTEEDLKTLEASGSKGSSDSAGERSSGSDWIDVLGSGELMKRVCTRERVL